MARRTKGDGSIYQRADGRWCCSVENGVNPDGTRRRKVLTAKTQAEVLAKLRATRRTKEQYGHVPTGVPTVEKWLATWLEEVCVPRLKPKTVDGYRHKVGLINESIGKVKLDRLSAADVRRMHRHATGGDRNNTTAMHCHRVLNTAMKKAVAEGLVPRNIVESEKAPKAEVEEVVTYSLPQARALLDAVSTDPIAGRWLVALLYGVRQGEALGLTWACVDYNAGSIALDWQLQRLTWRHGCGGGCGAKRGVACPQRHHGIPAGMEYRHLEGAWFLTRPKRDKRRTLPLLPIVEATLRARYDTAADQPNPYGLVFARPDGRPFDPALDNAAWHAWLKAAGLPDSKLHSARHTAATLLQALGVPEPVRMEILGHSVATTQRGYAHVDLSLQREGLAQLGAALGG